MGPAASRRFHGDLAALRLAASLLAFGLIATGCALPQRVSDDGPSSAVLTDEGSEQTQLDAAPPRPSDDEATTVTTQPSADPAWTDLPLELTLIAEFTEPIGLTTRAASSDLYVAERGGVIRVVERSFTSRGFERIRVSGSSVLDISDQVTVDEERGLLGIAFSTDGRFLYVSYTDLNGDSVLDEYRMGRGTSADSSTRREVLRVSQPFGNHNGGHLALGEDGFLYWGLGDGGSAFDPDGNGQDPSTLLGSILRIDPIAAGDESPYTIPNGNPFFDQEGGRPETWLWGVRNPWRFSFDRGTGDLWIADVGQDRVEEINLLAARSGGGRGANLGWATLEGLDAVSQGNIPDGVVPPVWVYTHEQSRCSVTGGYVYRGELLPLLAGVYLFGDFCTGELFGLQFIDSQVEVRALSVSAQGNELVSFGEGPDGELYVIELGGRLLRIQPAPVEEAES